MTEASLTLPRPRTGMPVAGLRVLSDQRLAQLAGQGDERAFKVIYDRHHQALFRHSMSILHNAEDAGDALQNTMYNAYLALGVKKREVTLKPWLHRIAHNESISLLRRRSHEEITEEAAASSTGAEGDAATRARLTQLMADMGELPERQRGALIMRELSGLEYGR